MICRAEEILEVPGCVLQSRASKRKASQAKFLLIREAHHTYFVHLDCQLLLL
jgi:hypothetical protein